MSAELAAVKRGYAYVEMNERGHFFSEGNYDILGPPRTDGDDAFTWMSSQPWSNGTTWCGVPPSTSSLPRATGGASCR